MKGHRSNLKARVFEFLGRCRKLADRGQIRFVSDDENNRRSAGCVGCFHNQNFVGGCGSCKRATAGLRRVILGDRVPDIRLGGCAILATDLQVMNLLDGNDASPVHNDSLPGHCWRKA